MGMQVWRAARERRVSSLFSSARGYLCAGLFLVLVVGAAAVVTAAEAAQCDRVKNYPESKREWLSDDAVFSVQEGPDALTIYGTDVSWAKDVFPLIGNIQVEHAGTISLVADRLVIDRDVVIDKLKFELVVDELLIERGRFLVQDSARTGDRSRPHDIALTIYANFVDGPLALSIRGQHRPSLAVAPIQLLYRTSGDKVFENSVDYGLSALHPGMCNNCLSRSEIGEGASDEDVVRFAKEHSRLAFWAGRRIFISNLINPSINEVTRASQLRVLDRLANNGYEEISPGIPRLSSIARLLSTNLDVLGGARYGADRHVVDVAQQEFYRSHEALGDDGLVPNILRNLNRAKKQRQVSFESKRRLEENARVRREALAQEDKVLSRVKRVQAEVERVDNALIANEQTLEGFIEFDAIVAKRDAKKKEQFAEAASGAKLVVTVVGSAYGGWGAAAAGAVNVGVDVATARRLNQKLEVEKSLRQGWAAYETAKDLGRAFEVVDKKWKDYERNRNVLREARRRADDVDGSWIDAMKLTRDRVTDDEKAELKKALDVFKEMDIEEFKFEPVLSNSAQTNALLLKQTQLEHERMNLLKNKADLEARHVELGELLASLDEYSRTSLFFSSLASGYEQKMWLLSAALDDALVDYFKKYYLLKSALHNQDIAFDEDRLDRAAWSLAFREYLNIAKNESSDEIDEARLNAFAQSLRTSSLVIKYQLENAIASALAKRIKTPFVREVELADLDASLKGLDGNGAVSFILLPESLLDGLVTDSHKAAYLTQVSLAGGEAIGWSIYALPFVYLFGEKRCSIAADREGEWVELGNRAEWDDRRPFRYHQLVLVRVRENAVGSPTTVTLKGFLN